MKRRQRRVWLALVGVVVAAAVAFGIAGAVARTRLEAREQLTRAWRAVDVVHGVVEESLEELRLRESARPFDHYNQVYSPEGVLAASDALAPSPLSFPPDDPRLRGWVQLNPDGSVTLPFDATRPELAATVRAEAAAAAFAPLRALVVPPAPPVVAQVSNNVGRSSSTRTAMGPALSSTSPPSLPENNDEQGALQKLNVASTNVYSQLKEAAAEPTKRAAIAQSAPLPKISRTDVDWSDEDLGKLGTNAKAPRKRSRPLEPKKPPSPAPQAPSPPVSPTSPGALSVSTTPMVFDELGTQRVLHRTVTSQADGSRTVQLVLLDEPAVRTWLEALVARRVDATLPTQIVPTADSTSCAVRAPVSSVLDDLDLCVRVSTPPDGAGPQSAVLVGLLLLVVVVLVVLDRAAEQADALARQRSAFVSAVSHELRTPLTTLRMYAELLRDGLVADADKVHRFHADMVQESVRLSHLVENVLEAQRLEEGRRPLRLEDVELGPFVAGVVNGQRPLLAQRGVAVDLDVSSDEIVLAVDRQAIEQTLVNLIENAVKYGRGAEARVHVGLLRRANDVVIAVEDHGPGVARDERERVFQRFVRIDRPGEEHVAGTGLGLALVRELARAHGGDASIVDSQLSAHGCRVEVRLPIRDVDT
jgi:signal transduction histidine kinase